MTYGLKLFKNEKKKKKKVVACRKFQAEEGFKVETFKNRVVHASLFYCKIYIYILNYISTVGLKINRITKLTNF